MSALSSAVGQKGHNIGHINLYLNFGISSMFPKWLQLQTSNLVGSIYKRKTRSQVSKTRSRGYILYLQTAVNNSETAKAIGF